MPALSPVPMAVLPAYQGHGAAGEHGPDLQFDVADEAFMVLEFENGSLHHIGCVVNYRQAFDSVTAMAMNTNRIDGVVLAAGILVLLLSGQCAAQGEDSFIGLFADSSRAFDAYCSFEGEQAIIELWVYCYPSVRGQSGAEFRVDYPTNVIPATTVSNDELISFLSGDLSSGVNILYQDCQWSVHWCFHQFLILATHELTKIDIVSYRFRNCEPDYTLEPVKKWMDVYLNYEDDDVIPGRICRPPPIVITGVEHSSWGTIKVLLK